MKPATLTVRLKAAPPAVALEGERLVTVSTGLAALIVNADAVEFFFFQAEDGIRDLTVTGVQTWALAICHRRRIGGFGGRGGRFVVGDGRDRRIRQIGRASCREEGRSRWLPYH